MLECIKENSKIIPVYYESFGVSTSEEISKIAKELGLE
jgi:hypothetical protein